MKELPKIKLEDFNDMMDFGVKKEDKGGIVEMSFDEMISFPNHKFKLYEGQQLDDMQLVSKSLVFYFLLFYGTLMRISISFLVDIIVKMQEYKQDLLQHQLLLKKT